MSFLPSQFVFSRKFPTELQQSAIEHSFEMDAQVLHKRAESTPRTERLSFQSK